MTSFEFTSDRFQDWVPIRRRSGRGQPIPNDFEDLALALNPDHAEDGIELEQLLFPFVDVLNLTESFHWKSCNPGFPQSV